MDTAGAFWIVTFLVGPPLAALALLAAFVYDLSLFGHEPRTSVALIAWKTACVAVWVVVARASSEPSVPSGLGDVAGQVILVISGLSLGLIAAAPTAFVLAHRLRSRAA